MGRPRLDVCFLRGWVGLGRMRVIQGTPVTTLHVGMFPLIQRESFLGIIVIVVL